jgi:hypothetical protein
LTVIRIAVLSVLTLGALAGPALAFGVQSVAAPRNDAHFSDLRGLARLMPDSTSETFRFGPSDQAAAKDSKVVYELKGGKPADRIDVADPRDNPFMPQPERSQKPAH